MSRQKSWRSEVQDYHLERDRAKKKQTKSGYMNRADKYVEIGMNWGTKVIGLIKK